MDPFGVIATRYAESTLPRVAHSALPDAPTQPFHPRRRLRDVIRAGRRRFKGTARTSPELTDRRQVVVRIRQPTNWPRACSGSPGVMRVTLQTIADLLGVSRMTVSNAFSHPDQLSRELRARILAAADELGYVGPDPAGGPSPAAPPARSACCSPTRSRGIHRRGRHRASSPRSSTSWRRPVWR